MSKKDTINVKHPALHQEPDAPPAEAVVNVPPPPQAPQGLQAPPLPASPDSYRHLYGVEAGTTAGVSYGNQTSIRDTDKRAGKPRSILNIPAARA